MKLKIKIIAGALMAAAILPVVVLCACKPGESNIVYGTRDMSEVVSRGSFVQTMENDDSYAEMISDCLIFNSYEEFCGDKISDLVLTSHSYNDYESEETITVRYKLKDERYNSDYFETRSLLITFFEAPNAELIVQNVETEGDSFIIDVVGYAYATGNNVYACFIELEDDISEDATAAVNCNLTDTTSSMSYYFNGAPEGTDDLITAYMLPDHKAMLSFIEYETAIQNTVAQSLMVMMYTEEFFEDNSLLFMRTPGEYRSICRYSDGTIEGIRLISDHYDTYSQATDDAEKDSYTAIMYIPVPKHMADDEIIYSMTAYTEWEEGTESQPFASGDITLTKTEDESNFTVYMQQG